MAITGLWQATRLLDRVIIVTVALIASLGLWKTMHGAAGSELVVEQDGRIVYVAPLAQPARAAIPGPLGITTVEIENGRASVVAASCPQRLCMAMGAIEHQGEIVACLPNRVLLRISGEQKARSYDFLTQ